MVLSLWFGKMRCSRVVRFNHDDVTACPIANEPVMDLVTGMDAPMAVILLAISTAMIVYERKGLSSDKWFFKHESSTIYWVAYLSLAVLGTAFLISALAAI